VVKRVKAEALHCPKVKKYGEMGKSKGASLPETERIR
jgi:hypothetical protein